LLIGSLQKYNLGEGYSIDLPINYRIVQ